MGNLKKLQIDGVDVLPLVSEYETYDSEGNSISNKYANKNTLSSQMVEVSNKITNANNQLTAVSNYVTEVANKYGDTNSLSTNSKDSMVSALNNIYSARDNAKQQIVNALSEKGITASTSESIESLINKINTIEVGNDIPEWYAPTNSYSNSWIAGETGIKPDGYNYTLGRCAAVDNNNNIYFVGGDCYSTTELAEQISTAVVTCYNANTNQWSAKRAYPFPISFGAAAYHNGYIYVCGGFEDWSSKSTQHYRYSIASNYWTSRTTMKYSGTNHTYTPVGNTLYAIGGFDHVCNSYSTQYNTWTTLTEYPYIDAALINPVAGAVNNTIYVADATTQTLFTYSTTSGTWTESALPPSLNIGESEHGMCSGGLLNNKLHVVFIGQTTKYHQCYDISTRAWTSKSTSTITPSCAGGSSVANGYLYILTLDSKLYCYIP